MSNLVKIGRRISYLLRHNPEDLSMDKNGWVKVSELLYKLDITKSMLDSIVDTNDKKRYSYNEDMTFIRANQGHSIDVDVELDKRIPPVVLYHGTSPDYVKPILKRGLNKMKRQHVHLSIDHDTALNVGKRHSKIKFPVILIVDCKSMVKDGYVFYLSNNGVWLTDQVPSKYLKIWE
jgi:putative RNA 2'-phosphotransferase